MKFSTFCLVAGNEICNARCPFCVAKMTPARGLSNRKPVIDWRNFHKAAAMARDSGVRSVMITGKGEPTLFPDTISDYLRELAPYGFHFIDLQTNALLLVEKRAIYEKYLAQWYDLGLTTVAVSVAHYLPKRNQEIYTPHRSYYPALEEIADLLHQHNFTMRIVCILLKNYVDNIQDLATLISFCKQHRIEQLSLQPVNAPLSSRDDAIAAWTKDHVLSSKQIDLIRSYIVSVGKLLLELPNGAQIYDVNGQNVCLTNCLTLNTHHEKMRQLIFFPNGNVVFDWQYEGALLLRGRYASIPASLAIAA